jgi:membrane dipeptidase
MRRSVQLVLAVLSVGVGCRENSATPAAASAAETVHEPIAALSASAAPLASGAKAPADTEKRAQELAQRFIILDGHVDVPYRLEQSRDKQGNITEDISARTEKGDFDWPRAKAGGLDAPFMSIYIPAKYETGGAKKLANRLIDMVEGFAEKSPDKFALARSPAEVRKNSQAGKVSLPMGMENGSPIERKLENVAYFHGRGIRYITLAHSKDNHISDSSYDDRHTHKGLSDFGKKVVSEMNRVGIMIDVSHVSDDAFWQVIELSAVPAIASHSSCRHFTPGWPRNMSDDMIRALGKKGGVIQINFGSGFIDGEIQKSHSAFFKLMNAELEKRKLKPDDPKAKPVIEELKAKHPKRYATVAQVIDHIDHAVKLAGVDHVGLGSDYDGVGDSLPTGLKDVSQYPSLIRGLLERGYSEADIEKICSGNVLRVWQAVEDHALKHAAPAASN